MVNYREDLAKAPNQTATAVSDLSGKGSPSPAVTAERLTASLDSVSSRVAVTTSSSYLPQGPSTGGQKSYPQQQVFPGMGAQGGEGVMGVAGAGSGGSGLMMATPSPSANSLSSALNMVSLEQDDSVFSPSSVDDERMKIIEKVLCRAC